MSKNMMNRRQAIKVTAIGAAAVLTSRARAQASTGLKLAHDMTTTSPWHIGAVKFADLVRERSNGALDIRVYPSAQLGDLRELGELTKLGTIDISLLTAGVAANFIPSMNLFGLPFLFRDAEQAHALYTGPLGRELTKDADAAGFKGLGFHILTFRSPMNSKRPIATPANLEGLQFRLQQVPIHLDTYSALGANPVALPYSEVYTAAQSGVIDGVENTPSGLYTPKFHEVMKFYSLLPVFINTATIVMSQKAWNNLSPDLQEVVEKTAMDANEIMNQEYFRLDDAALAAMIDHGIDVNKGPFDLGPWRAAVQPVYDKYVPQLSESARKVVASLKDW